MSTDNPYAPPKAAVADVTSANPAPALWNPNAAASWSLLFSPMFGAFLHMKNWQAMGEPAKAAASRTWVIISLAFFVLLLIVTAVLPDSRGLDAISRIAGFVLLVAWYYANGKAQNAFVLARYGSGYPRKGWMKPLGYAVLAILGFFVAGIVIGAISAALHG